MAWRLMSWDLADYLLVVGSVPSVLPLPGYVSFGSYFLRFFSLYVLRFPGSRKIRFKLKENKENPINMINPLIF